MLYGYTVIGWAIITAITGHIRLGHCSLSLRERTVPMLFAASIIVNTMLLAGFLLVMLGLARVAYGSAE